MNKKLFAAVQDGDMTIVIECLNEGADVNVIHADSGMSALILAASLGHTAMVEALIAWGANVNASSIIGTALIWAAREGHTVTVELLIAKGADVKATNLQEYTALMVAASAGHTATVEVLITGGADVNAVQISDVDCYNKMTNWFTPLMIAASTNHTATVEALIARGANVDATNFLGRTALMMAVSGYHTAMVEVLIANGACTQLDKNAETFLQSCKRYDVGIFLSNLLKGGRKALQETCRLRDQAILKAVEGHMLFELIKLIISFDCDLAFEHFSPYTLNRLKGSVIPQMFSVGLGDSNAPLITNLITNSFEEETKVQQDHPALPAISETIVPPFDDAFPVRLVMAEASLQALNDAVVPSSDLSSSSPAYYATLSSSSNITRTTSTVTIVETPEERRRKTDAALRKRDL
jgi:ankyrin repeat protein